MNCPGAEHAPVPGISPPAIRLRGRTAAELAGKYEAIFMMQSIALSAYFFHQVKTSAQAGGLRWPDKGMMPVCPSRGTLNLVRL